MGKKIWIMNHYATNQYLHQGGRHYWFAKNLIKKGYEPVIFCANVCHDTTILIDADRQNHTVKTVDGIQFVFVKTSSYEGNGVQRVRNMIDFYVNLLKIRKQVSKRIGEPDVILASSVHPLTIMAGIKMAKKFHIPCISEVRDLWPESIVAYGILKKESLFAKILYRGEKWLYKHSDAIIMTWQGGKQYIMDRKWEHDIDLKKIYHISNGVEVAGFDENSQLYKSDDPDLHDPTMKKVIYTGSIRHVNNLGLLLDAAKILQQKQQDAITFFIYGSGNEKEKLEKRVQEEGLSNVVFKGHVDKKYIPYILKQGTINVMHNSSTSLDRYGQSQNKFFEYLAAGRCIVQTYTTGFSMLDQYHCGFSAETQEATEIANKILLACDPEQNKQMGKNAREAAYYHDFDYLTDQLVEVMETVEDR